MFEIGFLPNVFILFGKVFGDQLFQEGLVVIDKAQTAHHKRSREGGLRKVAQARTGESHCFGICDLDFGPLFHKLFASWDVPFVVSD